MGKLLHLVPRSAPSCHECVFVAYHEGATHCVIYDEQIDSETQAASGCPHHTKENA